MKVTVLYDAVGWAQHRHALGLQAWAGPDFDVKIAQLGHISERELADSVAIHTIYFAGTRLREGIISATCIASHAWLYDYEDPNDWRTLGVNLTRNRKSGLKFLKNCNVAICRNRELESWAIGSGHPKARYYPAGVDRSVFHPVGRSAPGSKLRVGWCGQTVAKFKGYEPILVPLRDSLPEFDWLEITHGAKSAYTPEAMADWYRSLDVLITTATAEGTPNPPFEAAACGCVIVSTDMGQPADWTALRECGLVVPTYRNTEEAGTTISEFRSRLLGLQDLKLRREFQEILQASIDSDYNYRTLAPAVLRFICGVA